VVRPATIDTTCVCVCVSVCVGGAVREQDYLCDQADHDRYHLCVCVCVCLCACVGDLGGLPK